MTEPTEAPATSSYRRAVEACMNEAGFDSPLWDDGQDLFWRSPEFAGPHALEQLSEWTAAMDKATDLVKQVSTNHPDEND